MAKKEIEGGRLGSWVAALVVGRPWLVLLLSLAILAGLAPGIAKLRKDFTFRVWYRDADPFVVRFDQFASRFGNDDQVVVAVHSPSGIFDADSVRLIQELTRKLWLVPEVIRVDSLSNHNWIHASNGEITVEPVLSDGRELTPAYLAGRKREALADETIPDYLLSRDGSSALFYATISPEHEKTLDFKNVMDEVKSAIGGLGDTGDHVFHIAGSVALTYAFQDAATKDTSRLLPLVGLFIIAFLYVIYRSVAGVLLSLSVILVTFLATGGAAGWAGLTINSATSTLPQVVVAIGIAVTVHVMTSFFRYFEPGTRRPEAVRRALATNFVPTALTSLTTGIGFFSFSPVDIVPLAHLGIGAGFGMIAAWLFTFTFLGPLLVLIPMRARRQRAARQLTEARARRAAAWVSKKAGIILGVGIGLSALGLFAAARNVPNSDPYGFFSKTYPLTVAVDFLEKNFGGGKVLEIAIDSGVPDGVKDPVFLEKVDRYQKWLVSLPYVSKAVSIVDILKPLNRALHGGQPDQYVIPDSREKAGQLLLLYGLSLPQGMDLNHRITVASDAIRLTVLWNLRDSVAALKAAEEIEAKATEFGLKAEISGKLLLFHRLNAYVVSSFVFSILVATLLIAAIMIVALRSLRLGLLSLVPNILPVAMGGAVIWLSGLYFDIGTAAVASICLGIAVDDTVHFLVSYRDQVVSGKSPLEALEGVYASTGFAILATTIVLVVSFGSFALAEFVPNSSFGMLCAAVLTMGVIFEFLFLPALLLRSHRWLGLRQRVPRSRR